MISIQKFIFNPFSENTYVVFNDEKKAVIIDPGMYYEEEEKAIDKFIISNGLKLEAIWHTHSHLDHMFGTGYVSRKYNLDPMIFEKDLDTYQNFERVCEMYGVPIRNMPPEKVQFMDIKNGLSLGKTKFSVFFVPGHAPGHVVFHHTQSNVLINGDCLFRINPIVPFLLCSTIKMMDLSNLRSSMNGLEIRIVPGFILAFISSIYKIFYSKFKLIIYCYEKSREFKN